MPDQTFAFMDIFIDMKKKLCLDVNQLNIFNTFWSNLHYFFAIFFSRPAGCGLCWLAKAGSDASRRARAQPEPTSTPLVSAIYQPGRSFFYASFKNSSFFSKVSPLLTCLFL